MKYLEPETLRVNSISVVSHQTVRVNKYHDEVRERRVFLGFFDENITSIEIERVLTENDLWGRVVTMDALYKDSFKIVSAVPRTIKEGIVFENTDEFVQYLKTGLNYEDILEGYTRAQGETGV